MEFDPNPAPANTSFLTYAEVMDMLRIRSKVTMGKYLKAGLPAHQIVTNGPLLFDPAEVQAWVKSRCTSPVPGQGAA